MDRPSHSLSSLGLAGLVALLAAGAAGFSDEIANYKRLQAMPRERRVDLAENLDRFDRLDPKEQATIRQLDSALARKDPAEQAKYHAILRRYHLWVNGLTDTQKQELAAATDPDERFTLARKFRLTEGEDSRKKAPRVSGIRTGDFGLEGPADAAFLLKIWQRLTSQQQAEIAKRNGRDLRNQIRSHLAATGVRRDWPLLADEASYLARLEADADFKAFVAPLMKRAGEGAQKKVEASKKTDSAEKRLENPTRKGEHPFAEFLYFEEHPVRPVDSRLLERFTASCPPWLLGMLDPLPAEDARTYLTTVYRQLYPHPAEMPDPTKEKAASKPASKKAQAPPAPL